MNFTDWQQLVKNAGGDISQVDHGWLLGQFQAGTSPAIIANLIRVGQAPRPAPAPSRGPGFFRSPIWFLGFFLMFNGWLIILAAFFCGWIYLGQMLNQQNGLSSIFVLGSIVTGSWGAFFVVVGTYVRKNIHLFEN